MGQSGGEIVAQSRIQIGGEGSTENDQEDENIPDVEEALKLAVKVLNKTMDGTTAAAAAEKMELYTMTKDDNGRCIHHILNKDEASKVIDAVEAESASAGDS